MSTISQLQKQANAAPKFVLEAIQNGKRVFIAAKQTLFSCNLTTNIDEALKFSDGFDNPTMKIWGWKNCAKQNNLDIDLLAKNI